MSKINIDAGLAVKADVNQLWGDVVGTYAKFKEDRRYNKEAYTELLEKYGDLKTDVEKIKNQLNILIEQAQSNRLPDENDIRAIDAIAGLIGAKKQDGSLDLQKLAELNKTFGNNK